MLRPFSRFCVMIGAIPESIIHSLSYEQQLLRLVKFLKNTVIPAIDGNTTAIKAIEEWIENLDLQDEVDNKLDEMAESGELQEIISEYLNSQAIFGYNSVDDMKIATNLINGSYTKTIGFYSANDGGGASYKIREITNEDVVDNITIIAMEDENLIAELIIDKVMNPEMFGAKGDNTTDDTNSLNAMFGSNCSHFIMNKTYKVTTSLNTIENKYIEGIGTINFGTDTTGNIELNNTTIKGIDLKAPCTSTSNTNYVVSGSDYTIENATIEGITCIYSPADSNTKNVKLLDSTIKGCYRDISFRGLVNDIVIENCDFARNYDSSLPVAPDHHVYLYSNNTNSNVVDDSLLSCKGNNIEIKKCKFAKCIAGKRDLILINFNNVTVDQITTNNGELVLNGTDDLITFDLCDNVNVSNVNIDWSGENGIDILTCKNVNVSNCNIRKCDYSAISLDQSDVGSVFGFGEGINKDNRNINIKGCYLESNRACSIFVTTAYATEVSNCTLSNIYNRGSSEFYGKLIQIAKNSSGGIIKSLKITNNEYSYDSNSVQIWAYPGTQEQLAVFDCWNSTLEVDEEIGRIITLTNPNISSNANIVNVNLPLKRFKAYLLNTNDNKYYDITGLVMIKRPGQTENDVISRGGCYLAGRNSNAPYLNANVSFGDYISNTPINNSNSYAPPYGGTTGTVKVVFY